MTEKGRIILENILNRKSVRVFTGEPVQRADLLVLLRAAMAAPSARNRQPLAFVVITERELMDALADGLPHTKSLYKAGAAIVVCGDSRIELQQGASDLWYQDAGAATENILLAAEGLDLGAVWSALYPYPDRGDHVRHLTELPPTVTPFSIVPIGHPTGLEKPKEKFREEKIHWGKWETVKP